MGSRVVTAPESKVMLGPSEGIPDSTAEADNLVIFGTVFYQDCTPIAGAMLELWQADGDGVYGPGHGSDDMQCCYFQGTVQSDDNGRFEITTVYPGYYQGEASPPPAHIHVSIQLPGSEPGGRAIDTEIVFAGDPHLPPNAGSPAFTIVALEKIQAGGAETWVGEAEIVLDVDPP